MAMVVEMEKTIGATEEEVTHAGEAGAPGDENGKKVKKRSRRPRPRSSCIGWREDPMS
jgi:hypothetical protein